MGQKIPPLALRLGYTKTWVSRWFADRKHYAVQLNQDIKLRAHLKKQLASAAVAKIEIERPGDKIRVIIHTARPGVIIGRKGAEIDRLRDELHGLAKQEILVDIREIKNPALEGQLVAENVAFQLVKRIAFRRAMKKAVQSTMDSGGKGIMVVCDGRLGGAELSRFESYTEGSVPLGTFRADIEYGFAEAQTTYGTIGVKCWIYRGDTVFDQPVSSAEERRAHAQPAPTAVGTQQPAAQG